MHLLNPRYAGTKILEPYTVDYIFTNYNTKCEFHHPAQLDR